MKERSIAKGQVPGLPQLPPAWSAWAGSEMLPMGTCLSKFVADLQKEELGEALHEVDFQQLKIENAQFLEKIDERNQDLLQLKLTVGNTLQILNFYKVRQWSHPQRAADGVPKRSPTSCSPSLHHIWTLIAQSQEKLCSPAQSSGGDQCRIGNH